jgi:hypothetical protein
LIFHDLAAPANATPTSLGHYFGAGSAACERLAWKLVVHGTSQ